MTERELLDKEKEYHDESLQVRRFEKLFSLNLLGRGEGGTETE